jgi:hypothetical protein
MNGPRIQPPGSPSEADAVVAACEAWPTVSGYVPCHYKQGCGCEMVPARVRAAIAAMGQVAAPTPPASAKDFTREAFHNYVENKRPTPSAGDLRERAEGMVAAYLRDMGAGVDDFSSYEIDLVDSIVTLAATVHAEAKAEERNDPLAFSKKVDAAIRSAVAVAKAEQHAADVAALREHDCRHTADWLERNGPK